MKRSGEGTTVDKAATYHGWDKFVAWDMASRDTITVQRLYIDLAGDLVAGVLLSALLDWYLPHAPSGKSRLVTSGYGGWDHGKLWLITSRDDWWDECRITPEEFDQALERLCKKGLLWHGSVQQGATRKLCVALDFARLMSTEHPGAWWTIPTHGQKDAASHEP